MVFLKMTLPTLANQLIWHGHVFYLTSTECFNKMGQNAPLHCQNSAPGLMNIPDTRNVMQHMWG